MIWVFLVGSFVQDAINQLPDRAVTLDFVISKAIESSDSFRAIKANQRQVQSPALLGLSTYDPLLSAGISWLDDGSEPTQPFMPSGIESLTQELSLMGQTPLGQSLQLSISQQKNKYSFTTIAPTEFQRARLEAQIRQNLWRNFLGAGSRAFYRAGQEGSEALQASVINEAEKWLLQFVELFHSAWLAQRRHQSAQGSLERRLNLKKVVDRRVARGSGLQNDALQVQSAVLAAEVEASRAHLSLQELWRALVIGLSLPPELLKVDPAVIPMKLDESFGRAQKACDLQSPEQVASQNSESRLFESRSLSKQSEAQAKSQMSRFSLDAYAGLWASNNEDSLKDSFRDSLKFEHPGWVIGGELKIPLMRAKERAESEMAVAESLSAKAMASLKKSEIVVRWLNDCEGLKASRNHRDQLKRAHEMQSQREVLERKRFELGDTSVYSVVQAADDRSFSEMAYEAAEAELRNRAWKTLALSGALSEQLQQALLR